MTFPTGRRALLAAACLFLLAGCRAPAPEAAKSAADSRIVIETSDKSPKAASPDVRLVSGASEAEVGIAFYPGARLTSSQLVREGTDLTTGAELMTQDAYQDVLDFYRERYASPELKVVQQEASGGKLTLLNWRDPQGNYTVGLTRDNERKRTIITLARIKSSKKPQAGKR